jgi:MFS family permease
VTSAAAVPVTASSLRRMLLPLALAQFICSFAGSNMNVMINDISLDLHTDVQGVQVCITLFLLVMAALMIPCGKLTDRWGRKRCFILGLWIYGIGAVYLQVVRHYNAIQTGVIFTAATLGILLSSLAAGPLARKYQQRTLILAGFVVAIAGVIVLLAMVKGHPGAWYFAPGLFLIGTGLGVMLTPSVNVVQSAFPENLQGEISGLSRSVSNLGSSIGAAVAGTILVVGISNDHPGRAYGIAMIVLAFIGLIGLGATVFLPRAESSPEAEAPSPSATQLS